MTRNNNSAVGQNKIIGEYTNKTQGPEGQKRAERLALKKEKITHQVLNAKFHEQEAEIIAQAGRPHAVTIATNMAGRGTDIVLGGSLDAELKKLENYY